MSVSFKTDIVPLFSSIDIDHMNALGTKLDDYSIMSQPDKASRVYELVSSAKMPPGSSGEEPWSPDKVQLFKDWIDGGYQP
jgi:hypothetical protein